MLKVNFDDKRQTWKSCDDPMVYNPNVPLANVLLRSMDLYGSKIAQINDESGKQFTFGELRSMTIRIAQNLQKRGYNSRKIIGINSLNESYLAPCIFAALCLGCPINPLYSKWKPDIIEMFKLTEPTIIFCEIERYDVTVECLTEIGLSAKIFTLNGTKGDSEAVESLFAETGMETDFLPVDVDGINEAAFIMATSGTSGPCKGVCLSHAVLLSEAYTTNFDMFSNAITYNSSSVAWVSGLFTLIVGTICGAQRIQSTDEPTLELELRLIEKYKVTYVENVPYDLMELLEGELLPKYDLSSLKHMVVIGYKAPLSPLKEFNDKLSNGTVHNLYGMSELGDVSIDFPVFSGKDSVGRLVNGVTVKVIDEKGNRCGLNKNGEICVKPRFKFLGYYKNPTLTAEMIDSDGFFKTGDIGHFDGDGYLYIVDRKKNVINCRNDWVYPTEIEEVLLKSPDIKCVCVVGVPCDPIFELPAAVVERANGSTITEDEICKMVKDALLDDCQLLGGVYFVDSIPTSSTGKPLHRNVKQLATKLYESKIEITKL